jgi:signal transduction histidine kinase
VRHMPVGEGIETDQKRLALFVDVTDQREHQRRLEQQNERLEEFASIISHDLRNPLDVAIGRTNAVKERLSDEELEPHLARAQDAHGRMQRIITDVLSLAREGDRIDTTEPVPLDEVARDAWAHVDTEAASLDVETTLSVQADEEALTRAFENLFRNAIEHGSSSPDHAHRDAAEHGSASPDSQTRRDAAEHSANADAETHAAESPSARSARRDGSGHRSPVTVRVGELADDSGFFVADDGPGIPEDEREAVFEAGNGDGTGLGLAIVDRIATAHGWGVGVTGADDGGARFEFSGVELVSEERTAREV